MKAWLKGALIGLIIGIIFNVIYIESNQCPMNPPGVPHISGCGLGPSTPLFLLIFIVLLILISSFIGWLIEKRK